MYTFYNAHTVVQETYYSYTTATQKTFREIYFISTHKISLRIHWNKSGVIFQGIPKIFVPQIFVYVGSMFLFYKVKYPLYI